MKPSLSKLLAQLSLPCFLLASQPVYALETQGKIGAEALGFFADAKDPQQSNAYYSLFIEPEFYQPLGDNSELVAKLFYRYDAQSDARTHGDIRELMVNHFADDWELNFGIGKVFWGTTESRHLVDVINQVDWIESLDDEARLGQPMVQAKFIKEWGTLDLFVLPYFREIDYNDAETRPHFSPLVDEDKARFQSSDKQQHIDFAMRWNRSFEDLDLGISAFKGTQRTPLLTPQINNGTVTLIPTYVQTTQFGVDAQYIVADWLLKAEMLSRYSHKADYSKYNSYAAVAGFEYTLVGVFDSDYDIGLIGEYLYDQWQEITPFQKDWMSGVRFVMNDEQSTEFLLGQIIDLEDHTQFWQLEASRRLGEKWKLELKARWLGQADQQNPLYQAYNRDDLLSIKFNYYF